MKLLRTENLCKRFGNLVVTHDVNLAVSQGERHVVIGPNGAGKTSLIHQITGRIKPSSGRVFFNDRDITGMRPELICQMGIGRTFQKNNLFRSLDTRENVRLAVQARQGGWYQALRSARSRTFHYELADRILEQIGLTDKFDQPVSSLSYGEQRQLEIAIALAAEPKLLLLDEPTSGMSPAETEHMVELVRALPDELTVLMIEHDMKVVFSLADQITVLHYGEVLAQGKPQDIRGNCRVREVYLGGDVNAGG